MKLYPNVSYLFAIWLALILTIAYIGFSTLPHSNYFSNNFWTSFANWDGGHYTGIAQVGYSQKFQFAFFPLYPLLIKALSVITHNYLIAAVLISVVSTFLGLQLFYKLVLDFNKKIAEKAVLALMFFPTSFYFLTAYSEGLFFFLVVLTFFLIRKKKLFWATVAASLVSATRIVGLAVVVGLLIEVITTQGLNRKNWFIILSPLGFLLYCVFLYQQTGDPFYFISAETHWQRTLTIPGIGFWETLKNMSGSFNSLNISILLDLIFAVFGVGLVLRSFRFLPISFSVYGLLSVLLPLLTPTLSSMPRFLLVVFPIFIVVAFIKNYYLQLIFQLFSISLLAIFTALFFAGYWVS